MDRRSAITACLLFFAGSQPPKQKVKENHPAARKNTPSLKTSDPFAFIQPLPESLFLELADAESKTWGISELIVEYKGERITISAAEIFKALKDS